MKNTEVSKIVLKGSYSGIHIATILTWLLPKEAALVKDRHLIVGSHNARLTIALSADSEELQWSYCEFNAEKSITALIQISPVTGPGYGSTSPTRFPRSAMRNRAQMLYGLSSKEIVTVGQVANAFLGHIVEEGKLVYSPDPTYEAVGTVDIDPINILDISTDWFLAHYRNIMCLFGWTEMELQKSVEHQAKLDRILQSRLTSSGRPRRLDADAIMNLLQEYLDEQGCIEIADCAEQVFTLATEALIFTVLEPTRKAAEKGSLQNFFTEGLLAFQDVTSIGARKAADLVGTLVNRNPVCLGQFRQHMLLLLLPNHYQNIVEDVQLITESDGVVIYPKMLKVLSCRRNDALALIVEPGQIRKDDTRYSVVEESKDIESLPDAVYDEPRQLQAFGKAGYQPLIARSGFEIAELRCYSSANRAKLIVKSYIGINGTGDKRSAAVSRNFFWLRAMNLLAGATHLGGQQFLTPRGERQLAERMANGQAKFETMQWIRPESGHHDKDIGERRFLVRTNRSDLIRLYHLSLAAATKEDDFREKLMWPVFQHEAPLLACINEANERSANWIILT